MDWKPFRVVVLVGVFSGFAAGSPAQEDFAPTLDVVSIQDRPGFVEAVGQVAQGHEREGLAALAEVLARFPDDADRFLLHYNAACGHARLGETEAAFHELGEAVDRGYGVHPRRLQNLALDPDLEPLRSDARYAALFQRASEQCEAVRANWAKLIAPFVWLPPASDDPEVAKRPHPLLIVLHPFGTDREAFARANFLPFCEKHRFALLAPSGEQMVAPGHFAWALAEGDFVAGFRQQQRRVFYALQELRKTAAIDPQRIYVAGAGQGAGLGFAVAIRNPPWVRGAVLFGGGYAPATLHDWTERAAASGRRLALVHGADDGIYPIAPLAGFVDTLKAKGIAADLVKVEGGHDFPGDAVTAQLQARIAWIDEVPFEKPGAKAAGQGR